MNEQTQKLRQHIIKELCAKTKFSETLYRVITLATLLDKYSEEEITLSCVVVNKLATCYLKTSSTVVSITEIDGYRTRETLHREIFNSFYFHIEGELKESYFYAAFGATNSTKKAFIEARRFYWENINHIYPVKVEDYEAQAGGYLASFFAVNQPEVFTGKADTPEEAILEAIKDAKMRLEICVEHSGYEYFFKPYGKTKPTVEYVGGYYEAGESKCVWIYQLIGAHTGEPIEIEVINARYEPDDSDGRVYMSVTYDDYRWADDKTPLDDTVSDFYSDAINDELKIALSECD